MDLSKLKMNDADVYIAIKKCNNTYGSWCGYLRPDEIVELVRRKYIIPNKFDEHKVDNARNKVEQGIMNPTWFYFQPRKQFLEFHRGMKKERGPKNGSQM